ncbi:MAG: DUF2817 domain-containing protein [Deltaproteobacteria bacterium]|nr:DUF2817 domain-containing protein [Deltaproteobacteria bacterium]
MKFKKFIQYHLRHQPVNHPAQEHELGIVRLGYNPIEFKNSLWRVSEFFEVRERTRIEFQGSDHPIFEVRLGSSRESAPRLFILSGIHGNEEGGILAVPVILERLREQPQLVSKVNVRILAPVNPVGAYNHSRYNASGHDINRDFVNFRTPEARLIRLLFDEYKPDFVLSLHEGPQRGTFMFANACVPATLALALVEALQRAHVELAERDYFGRRLDPPGLAVATWPSQALVAAWARYFHMMTVHEYAARRGIPEITLETSWRSGEWYNRILPHVELVLELLKQLGSWVQE